MKIDIHLCNGDKQISKISGTANIPQTTDNIQNIGIIDVFYRYFRTEKCSTTAEQIIWNLKNQLHNEAWTWTTAWHPRRRLPLKEHFDSFSIHYQYRTCDTSLTAFYIPPAASSNLNAQCRTMYIPLKQKIMYIQGDGTVLNVKG